ncbi:methyltransferase domain-containing protein [soil metagenome]
MQTTQTPIAFSGKIPVNYDTYLGPMFFEPYALDLANRISKLKAGKILELASGTGRLTKLLPAVIDKATEIIASDINPSMVAFGKEISKNENIKWMEIDAVSLPFEDETFDLVVVQFGVMFYSDKVKAFKEAHRVLKPGGTFLFNCWDEINNNPMPIIANEVLRHFFPENTPAFYSVPFSYFNDMEIKSDLQKAGFEKTEIELLFLTGFSKSPQQAAKGLIEGTPTITAIEDRDPTVLPELIAYLEDKIIQNFGSATIEIPLRARVVSTIK